MVHAVDDKINEQVAFVEWWDTDGPGAHYAQLPRWKSCKLLNCFPDRSWGGRATGYKLSPSNWNALCWVGVGLVTMVSGYFGVIAVTMVF